MSVPDVKSKSCFKCPSQKRNHHSHPTDERLKPVSNGLTRDCKEKLQTGNEQDDDSDKKMPRGPWQIKPQGPPGYREDPRL